MTQGASVPAIAAIGGVGGSGTRVGAALLQMLGYYIGDDLNGALDNLWFTLIFKRRSILLETEPAFCALMSLFMSRMRGRADISADQRAFLIQLAGDQRLQHPRDWLLERVDSFGNGASSKRTDQAWGWKEPNTHIAIERMFCIDPNIRYLQFVRHPIDMALSSNQSQLQNWGPIMLNRDVEIGPRLSLTYWCAVHRRVLALADRWPQRLMPVDFEALCREPQMACAQIAGRWDRG
jgi:Sulfotransferase family